MKKYTSHVLKLIIPLILFPGISFSQTSLVGVPENVQNQPLAFCVPCAGAKWIDPENVKFTDNQLCSSTLQPNMTCFQDQCYWSRYLDCQNFGFSIPGGALIKGIQLDLTGFSNINSSIIDNEIFLLKNNLISGSNMALSGYWPITTTLRSYGGGTELWGTTWTATDIDSANFGVYIKVKNMTSLTPTVYIDGISITVTYELATGVFTQTSTSSPLTVYANQSSEELSINFHIQKENKITQLTLYDIQGKKCFSKGLTGNPGNLAQEKINTSQLKSGIYFVNVNSDNKLYSTKFILTR